jgi:hypothetical protein
MEKSSILQGKKGYFIDSQSKIRNMPTFPALLHLRKFKTYERIHPMNQQRSRETDASDSNSDGGIATVAPPKSLFDKALAKIPELKHLINRPRQKEAAIALFDSSAGDPYISKYQHWRCTGDTDTFVVPAIIDGVALELTTHRGQLRTENADADLSVRNLMNGGEVFLYWEELQALMTYKADLILACR